MAHDLLVILKSAQTLKPHGQLKYIFVGEGAIKNDLIAYKQSNALDQVSFYPALDKSQMPAVWSVCDIVVISLKNDKTFATVVPSKLFEAMAMSKVIVLVAPAGEASKLVDKHQCGVWILPGSHEQLAETILYLCKNRDFMTILAQNALFASKLYTRENQASQFIDALQSIGF